MELAIGELAKAARVTRRTIRYYIEVGLIPPPSGEGRGALYGEDHLRRLTLIRKLQTMRLSLDEIRERLATEPAVWEQIADESPAANALEVRSEIQAPEGAADYIRRLRSRVESYAPEAGEKSRTPTSYDAEQWTRIVLDPDVELNVRRRGSRIDRRIAKLIMEARRIFEEEDTP